MDTVPPYTSNGNIPTAPGIYKITCTVNGKFYIGSARNMRHRQYRHFSALLRKKHENQYLQRAWNKYGEQCFTFEVVELVLETFRVEREQYWLDKLKPFGRKGFNIAHNASAPPGWRGRKQSPEHVEKRRQAQIGVKHTPESNEKVRQARLGKKLSPESIAKRTLAQKGRKLSPEHIEKMKQGRRLAKPYKHTPEALKKMSLARQGKKQLPEITEKIRQSRLRNKQKRGDAGA